MVSVCGMYSRSWVTPDDSLSDRLHRLWTSCGLLICASILVVIAYLGSPIDCWCPAYFTGNHIHVAQKICWQNHEYYWFDNVSSEEDAPPLVPFPAYYRWVPIIMLCQALLCLLPYIFWRLLNTLSPLKLTAMIRSAKRGQNSCSETERQTIIQYLSNTLKSDMEAPGGRNRNQPPILGIVYLLTKLFYVINCWAQLVFLELFLKWDKYPHGVKMMVDLFHGSPTFTASVLPRSLLCDFGIRQMGNFHRHTVQCALPYNELAEWMFLLIWFWFSLLLLINISSLLYWTLAYIIPPGRQAFLVRHLKTCGVAGRKRSQRADWLIFQMSCDAALTLALLAENTDDAMVCDVISDILRHNDMTPSQSPPVDGNDGTTTLQLCPEVQEENIPLYPSLQHDDKNRCNNFWSLKEEYI